jgi:hypothetical protein
MSIENCLSENPLITEAKATLLAELDESIAWYSIGSQKRGWWARWLRVWMISFGGISAIIPPLSQIKFCEKFSFSPLWASVFIALTATLFAFEKFYGHSEAWMRFILAKQELERIKAEFLLSWLGLTLTSTSPEALKKAVEELMRTSKERHLIIKKETSAWTKVFESGIKSSSPAVTGASATK